MSARTVLAVDLGGTKLAAALIDEEGALLWRARAPVARESVEAVAFQVAELAAEARRMTGRPLVAAGCIVPGIVRLADGAVWAPNLWGFEFVPFGEALRGYLGEAVFLDNDRAGHLLGEHWLGAARGASDAVFLAVGTGIGAGILSGGRILRGAHGIAGAAGWMCLDGSWREEYARAGCYEWLAAGPALARMAGEATGLALEAEAVVASARAGEEWACRLVDELARIHGRAVANLVSLLDPEVVVLGGGLFSDAGLFLEGIEREIVRWAQPVAARALRVAASELGADAGLFGAARLALWPEQVL